MKNTKVRGIAVVLLCGLLVVGLFSSAFSGGAPEESEKSQGSSSLFVDVPADHWAYDELSFCVERGLITGLPSGKFGGEAALTRYAAAALIARTVKYLQKNPDLVSQKDLEAMQDLLFKTSKKLQELESEVGQFEQERGSVTTLERKVSQNQQEIASLNQELSQAKASNGNVSRLQKKANANFIIGVTGLFVGIVAVALASLI